MSIQEDDFVNIFLTGVNYNEIISTDPALQEDCDSPKDWVYYTVNNKPEGCKGSLSAKQLNAAEAHLTQLMISF